MALLRSLAGYSWQTTSLQRLVQRMSAQSFLTGFKTVARGARPWIAIGLALWVLGSALLGEGDDERYWEIYRAVRAFYALIGWGL